MFRVILLARVQRSMKIDIVYIGGTTTSDDGMTLNKDATPNSYGDVICKDNVVLGRGRKINTHGNFTWSSKRRQQSGNNKIRML